MRKSKGKSLLLLAVLCAAAVLGCPASVPVQGGAPVPATAEQAAPAPVPTPTATPAPTPTTAPEATPMPTPTQAPAPTAGPAPTTTPAPVPAPTPDLAPAPDTGQDAPVPSPAPPSAPAQAGPERTTPEQAGAAKVTPAPVTPEQAAPGQAAAETAAPADAIALSPGVAVPQSGHWYFGGPWPYYQGGVYRLGRSVSTRSANAAGVTARLTLLIEPRAGGTVFLPDTAGGRWTLRHADYTVTYCADPDRPLEQSGALQRFTALPLSKTDLPEHTRRALAAVLPRCYPYVSANGMLADLRAAGCAVSDDCDEAELIAGVQAALYQILDGRTAWGYAGAAAAADEGYVLPGTAPRDTAAQDIHAVRDHLLALAADPDTAAGDMTEVYTLADWHIDCTAGADGAQEVTVRGRLNIPVRSAVDPTSGESDRVDLVLTGGGEPQSLTLTAGEQDFAFTLHGVPAGAELTLTGSYTMAGYPEVYYYEGPEGAQPQLGVRIGSKQGVFARSFPPLCARGRVTVEKQWMIGAEPFKAGHTAAEWQTYRAYVRRRYGLTLPETVTVQLLANGTPLGEPAVLAGAEDWRHTWPDLPLYDEAGHSIAYSVSEPAAGPGYRTDVYCYTDPAGSPQGCGYTLLLSNYYIPCDPQAPVQVRAVWADGAPHTGDTVRAALTADGSPAGAAAELTADGGFAGDFGTAPVLALRVDYGSVFNGEPGVAPLVLRRPIDYGVTADPVPGYTATVTREVVLLPYAAADFAAGPSRAVQVLLGEPARALALVRDEATGLLTVTTAEPDPTDLRQQWAAYNGHLYSLFALVWGAQEGFEHALDWAVGELTLAADGVRFAADTAPDAPGPLCWRGGRLCNGEGTLFLALGPSGRCAAAGPGGGCPVRLQALGQRFTVTLTPVPTPAPTSTPTPAPTPKPNPMSTPSPGSRSPYSSARPWATPRPLPCRSPAPPHTPAAAPAAAATPAAATPAPTPVPTRHTVPATGDGFAPALWSALFFAALAGLAALARRRRRAKK